MTKFLNNADIKGYIAQTAVTSYLLKADSTGRLVAAIAGTDYQAPTTALLPSGGTAGQILAKIDGANYNTQWIDNYTPQVKHDVKLGAALSKGTPVYVSSANGTNMIVSAASNASEATSSKTLGLLETGGALNDTVKVITEGLLSGLNTSTATAGDPVWLGPNGTLLFGLANKPSAPVHMVSIGIVTRVQSVNGEIFVKVQNGFELDELHNVALASSANNEGLFYDSATSLWKNKTIAAVLGYTPANGANYLPLTGGTLTGDLTLSGTNPRLYFTDTDNNPDYFISNTDGTFTVYDVTNSVGRFKIYSGGNAELTGKVGVGGAAATYSLTAYNSANGTTAAFGGTVYGIRIDNGGTYSSGRSTIFGVDNSFYGTYQPLSIEASVLTLQGVTGGNVLINTTTDAGYKLDVNGSLRVATSLYTTGGTRSIEMRSYAADWNYMRSQGSPLVFGTQDAYNLYIRTSDVDRLIISSTGAATFSSSVTTGGNVTATADGSTGGLRFTLNNTGLNQIQYALVSGGIAGDGNFALRNGSVGSNLMIVTQGGQIRFNNYTSSSSFSGTAAGYLAFDSSGNVITVAGVAATDNTKLPLAGGTMTGDITINGQRIKELSSTNKGIYIGNWFGAGYWGLGSTATAHELKLDQVSSTTGAWENATDVNLYLGNNRLVLHSGNYNSYSPTLTGGGASGTWGINISGTASNITAYTINQNLGTGNDVTHAILRASSYVVTPLIYSGGGNVVLGNNLQVGSGLSTNSTYDANFFGRFTPDGKYLTRNWQLNDGGYTWSSLNYTQISDSPIGSYTMRGNNNSYTAQRQSGWVAIDRTKTYKVSVWYRTISGSPLVYLSFTQAGWDLSQPDNGGWGQPYFAVVNTSSTTWQEFTMTIGPSGSGAGYTWYSYARYAQLGVLMNYNNSGNAEITGFKMEEVDSTLANNTTVLGDSLYVGTSTSSNIYMTDSDESTRRIHCNSGRIGFLNTSASWGAYCDNSGNWISDNSLRAPIFYDSNDTSYYLDPNSTGTSLNVAGTVRGSYYVASNYASTGYTQYKGYDNNNHFIMVRGRVTGNTTSPTYTGYHRTSLVEYAEANDDTGWFFQTAATGNYDIVARITRSYSQFEGSVRAPIFYDSNDTGYYGDFASTSRMNTIVYNDLKWAGDQSYGFLGRNVYADTINGRGSDPLELNYYDGGDVRIGTGVNGSKGLYAGALYDAGSRVAISRGEGRNYVDYSRYVYNNGAYSGSGWVEPSDLGVRYANSAGSASSASVASYLSPNYVGGQQTNPQVYFNYSIGLKVAMTGAWSVWSDTMWINGYTGGDVPWMCALHFLRNSEPRMAISAQTRDSGGYGTYYEILSTYNASYAKNMNQNVRTSDDVSFQFITGARRVMGEYLYSNGWVYSSGGNTGWLQDNQNQGIRAAGYNSYFGTIATYGNNSNGYGGYTIMNNYRVILMQNSSGDFGFYNNDDWKWNLFYNRGNDCWGIGTDNTYSGDGFRCIKYGSAQYGWTTWSDRRAKENISTITGALDKVLNMRGVYFNYIIDEEKTKRVGFIAQELQEILPEAVRYAEEIDEYNVEYGQIVSVLTEAIKEQNIKIQSLEAQLQTLLN